MDQAFPISLAKWKIIFKLDPFPILGMLMLCYSQMQLAEVMIWKGIDTNNPSMNERGTTYAKYSLPAHNIALGIGVLIAYRNNLDDIRYWFPLICGLLFYIFVLELYYRKKRHSKTTPACETDKCKPYMARLEWPFPHEWYTLSFFLSITIMIGYVRPLAPSALIAFVFFSVTWIVTYILGKRHVLGSFWCWSTAILAPILLILNSVLTRNIPNIKS